MVVTLVDRDGTPIEGAESATVSDPKHAPAAAGRLLRDHLEERLQSAAALQAAGDLLIRIFIKGNETHRAYVCLAN